VERRWDGWMCCVETGVVTDLVMLIACQSYESSSMLIAIVKRVARRLAYMSILVLSEPSTGQSLWMACNVWDDDGRSSFDINESPLGSKQQTALFPRF
jgi:hypothetical protein